MSIPSSLHSILLYGASRVAAFYSEIIQSRSIVFTFFRRTLICLVIQTVFHAPTTKQTAAEMKKSIPSRNIGAESWKRWMHVPPTIAIASAVRRYARNVRSFANRVRSIASSSRRISSFCSNRLYGISITSRWFVVDKSVRFWDRKPGQPMLHKKYRYTGLQNKGNFSKKMLCEAACDCENVYYENRRGWQKIYFCGDFWIRCGDRRTETNTSVHRFGGPRMSEHPERWHLLNRCVFWYFLRNGSFILKAFLFNLSNNAGQKCVICGWGQKSVFYCSGGPRPASLSR